MTHSAVVVTDLGKTFYRYHPDRPWTLQEVLAKGGRRMRPVERFWGLRNVSFQVPAGSTVGIVGANGSGKSTLLRLIGGIGRPDTGRAEVNGKLGALLDLGVGFHGDLTGRENVVACGILSGLTRREVLERLDAIVAFAEIDDFIDNPVRTYSSGMQMRLAFSTAIHTEPDILLIDEVLAVGDLSFQRKCLERILQFKAAGCSILIVSHSAETITELCDEALWLHMGRLVAHGNARDVVGRYVEQQGGGLETFQGAKETAVVAIPSTSLESHPPPETAGPPEEAPVEPLTKLPVEPPSEPPVEAAAPEPMRLIITNVRLLDENGQRIAELRAGDRLRLEMDYAATGPLLAPMFAFRIRREDDVMSYGFWCEVAETSFRETEGRGHVSVDLGQIDLAPMRHLVDVGCYTRDMSHLYSGRSGVLSFVVREPDGTGGRPAPYRWSVTRQTADAIKHAV